MKPREIRPGVHAVGAIDWDRRLFDALIPLPDGTSYNSYLIRGSEKTALVDTVDPPMQLTLFENLGQLGVDRIDYVIANHAEPDHSGTLPQILAKYPEATVLASPKCRGMLVDMLLLPEERIRAVEDGETVSLGDRTLEFIHTPWVHWPETMVTYLREERILFSCDFFGSHVATADLYVSDEAKATEAAKIYYAQIMMPFRSNIRRNLERLRDYEIDIIAPSHGPLHDHPEVIMAAYGDWVSETPTNSVVVAYVSMHGSTLKMVEHLLGALVREGVSVSQFDLTTADTGKLASALVDAATVVIAAPTVLGGAHPLAANAAFLVNALKPKTRFLSVIGSFGWGGRAVEQLAGMLGNVKAEVLEPVLCRGFPREDDFAALDRLAATIAAKHRESGFA